MNWHTSFAWSLVGLWVLALFWHVTTGEWRQYIPTLSKVDAMIKYYAFGIFTGAPHPFKVTRLRKHNLKNAFQLELSIRGRHMVIVDDVVTTGSTVAEISRLLLRNGEASVQVWCLCRTL